MKQNSHLRKLILLYIVIILHFVHFVQAEKEYCTSLSNIKETDHHSSSINIQTTTMAKKSYEQDGEEARAIAQTMPYFPFKGIPRFYDIGGFLSKPEVFQQIIDIFSSRYDDIGIDVVAG